MLKSQHLFRAFYRPMINVWNFRGKEIILLTWRSLCVDNKL